MDGALSVSIVSDIKIKKQTNEKKKKTKQLGTIGTERNKINQPSVFVSHRNIINDRCLSSSNFLSSCKLKLQIVKLSVLCVFIFV